MGGYRLIITLNHNNTTLKTLTQDFESLPNQAPEFLGFGGNPYSINEGAGPAADHQTFHNEGYGQSCSHHHVFRIYRNGGRIRQR